MHYALNREEYKEVLNVEYFKLKSIFDEEFKHIEVLIEDAKIWDQKVSGINHLLSIIIEQLQKKGINVKGVIDFIYEFNEKYDFEIQQGNLEFLESLFKNDYNPEIELEEELIIAQNRIYRDR